MFSDLKTVSLGTKAIFKRTHRQDSSGITAGPENDAFRAEGEADVIRYRIALPELKGDAPAFLSFRYALKVRNGGATHVSIVNQNVSDGAIWEIHPEDCEGFSLPCKNRSTSVFMMKVRFRNCQTPSWQRWLDFRNG